ncbi:MAG: ATPase, T2SS/T4P/T4SS family [Candidatus Binatia bacterium]
MATKQATTQRTEADKSLLSFLIGARKLDPDKAEEIEVFAADQDLSLTEALAARAILGEDDVAAAVAVGLKLPLLNLTTVAFDDQVTVLIKEDLAERFVVVPVRKDGDALILAMANPLDQEAIRAVEFTAGCRVQPVVAPRSAIVAAIDQCYKNDKSLQSILSDIPNTTKIELVRAESSSPELDLGALTREAEGAPVIKMVNLILVDALASAASDIHIEPGPNLVQVRYRIHGVLDHVMEIPKWAQSSVVARIKVMAKLDITERRVPQDGHVRVRYEQNVVDFRVSSLPTADGEKIVMRVVNAATGLRKLDEIGLANRDLGELRRAIRAPEGMILVTGPTGSGKTTTLYSAILEILSPELDIVTVENPIAYPIETVSQVEVNEKQGMTFATALRSILRQDPDVILVGEIRDRETAEIAFQAARTGHLVFSTLPTNDTVSTIARLVELGVDHHVLASSLLAVVAQRLVRTVCPRCAESAPIPAEDVESFGLRKDVEMRGEGCAACRHTGFAARTGIFEVLMMSPQIRKLIESKAPESQLRQLAEREGMVTLRADAVAKIESGLTTPGEAARVVQLESRELRCPECASPIEENFSVCPYCLCQLRLPCRSCGATLKKEWKSCPFCEPSQRSSSAPRAAVSPGQPQGAIDVPRILIVDDNEALRKIIRTTLEHAPRPMKCDEAVDGFEALGKVAAGKPHLILLDVMMPGMDGIEVCRQLRAKLETAFIPVIMLTAREDTETKELGFLAGTDDYVTKPFERPALLARVERLLERTYGWVPGRRHASPPLPRPA